MRALIQRVKKAQVDIEGSLIARIDSGLLVFLGIEKNDTENDLVYLADKIANLRIFTDDQNKLNLSIDDINGEILVVSQFTLVSDCQKGNRPSFSQALPPDQAEMFYNRFVQNLKEKELKVKTGKFGASMNIDLINEGPVTIFLDSRKRI